MLSETNLPKIWHGSTWFESGISKLRVWSFSHCTTALPLAKWWITKIGSIFWDTLLRECYIGKCNIEYINIVTTHFYWLHRCYLRMFDIKTLSVLYQQMSRLYKCIHIIHVLLHLLLCVQNYTKRIKYGIIPTVTMYHNIFPSTSNNWKHNCQYTVTPFSCQYDTKLLFWSYLTVDLQISICNQGQIVNIL